MNTRNHLVAAGILVSLSVLVLGPQVRADAYAEREALTRLVQELAALEPLIVEASQAADPDARIRFQYDWLRQDLRTIRRGIESHIEAPRSEPRSIPPLRGDYRR